MWLPRRVTAVSSSSAPARRGSSPRAETTTTTTATTSDRVARHDRCPRHDRVLADRAPGRRRRRHDGAPPPAEAGGPGGTLRVGVVGSTNDLIDGQYIVAKPDQARLVAGWETLVNYDADFNISYEHGLAEEIETEAADLYVIRLKEGIQFHDGKPVTADDVIYSFQRRLDPDLGLAPGAASSCSTPAV